MMENFNKQDYFILVVDDIPANIKVLGNILNNLGYNFEFATSGKAALQWMDKKDFDLVLLDVMMPEMDGIEVCTAMRANEKWKDVPIIFLTAKNEKESLLEGFGAGAQDYITKPFDARELAVRVQTQIELRASKKELKRLNNSLETKVEERTQELALANKQLLALDNAKNEFLKVISHELRTPLNGIIGPLQILLATNTDAEIIKWLELLQGSVDRLEYFTLLALRITELQMDKNYVRKENIQIQELCTYATESFTTIDKQRLQFVGIDQTKSMYADVGLMKECLSILIENALKHSAEHEPVEVKYLKTQTENEFIISDKGDGFTDQQLESMNSLFFNAEKHIDQNTGLPISFVHKAIEAQGGSVLVTCDEDETHIAIKLPFSD